jgi:hypothetical protein
VYALEQVFLRLRGGQMEVLLVLENLAGARHRETLTFPTQNPIEAARRSAKHLAQQGDVNDIGNLRLRIERSGVLKDDPSLKRLFAAEFEEQRGDIWD